MKLNMKQLFNPFERVAGYRSLLWGIAGMIIATLFSVMADIHYHGLLHFGPAPNPVWWCFAIEHLVVWIVPAVLFYIFGLIFSKSRIRPVDVLGTTAFAQLPFILMSAFYLLPPLKRFLQLPVDTMVPQQLLQSPDFIKGMWLSLIGMLFLIWVLIWMYQAFRISCNLKGYKLGLCYAIAILGGDFLCRSLIGYLCYR
ncbi:MAG: YIP1 family protein [Barnesiella sp.]